MRGIGLAWGEGAPIPAALRADAHCTCGGSTQALPRTLAHDDVWNTPPHPRPRQEREARLATGVSSSVKRTTSSTSPPPRGNARINGGGGAQHVSARARSAHAFGAVRVARGGEKTAAGARARSAHTLGSERVARGQAMAASGCAAHTGAQRPQSAAPCAERRARSARRRSGSLQAPGAQRPRHRRRARSARRRQLACWRSQHTLALGGLCLLANSHKKGSPALWPWPSIFESLAGCSGEACAALTI